MGIYEGIRRGFADAKKLPRRHPEPKGRKRNKDQPKKARMARKGDRAGFFIFIRKMYKTDKKAGGFIEIGHE